MQPILLFCLLSLLGGLASAHECRSNRLLNGRFERTLVTKDEASRQVHAMKTAKEALWRTAAADGQIKIVKTGYHDFTPSDGIQAASLSPGAAIYQDVATEPGTKMYWSFHAILKQASEQATISVAIGSPQNVLTQQTVNAQAGDVQATIGEYVVPAGQTTTRFVLTPISGETIVDDVRFGASDCVYGVLEETSNETFEVGSKSYLHLTVLVDSQGATTLSLTGTLPGNMVCNPYKEQVRQWIYQLRPWSEDIIGNWKTVGHCSGNQVTVKVDPVLAMDYTFRMAISVTGASPMPHGFKLEWRDADLISHTAPIAEVPMALPFVDPGVVAKPTTPSPAPTTLSPTPPSPAPTTLSPTPTTLEKKLPTEGQLPDGGNIPGCQVSRLLDGNFERVIVLLDDAYLDITKQNLHKSHFMWEVITPSAGQVATVWHNAERQRGMQYVEVQQGVTIRQMVKTEPGAKMTWSLFQAPRTEGQDVVMSIDIGAPGQISPQAQLTASRPAGQGVEWTKHSGVYVVPQGQTITQFSLTSVSGASLVDEVKFSSGGCGLLVMEVTGEEKYEGNEVADFPFTFLITETATDPIVEYTLPVGMSCDPLHHAKIMRSPTQYGVGDFMNKWEQVPFYECVNPQLIKMRLDNVVGDGEIAVRVRVIIDQPTSSLPQVSATYTDKSGVQRKAEVTTLPSMTTGVLPTEVPPTTVKATTTTTTTSPIIRNVVRHTLTLPSTTTTSSSPIIRNVVRHTLTLPPAEVTSSIVEQNHSLPPTPATNCRINQLQDAGFESYPTVCDHELVPTGSLKGWKSTSSDGLLAIHRDGFRAVDAASGRQYSKIRKGESLYQDVVTVPGSLMRWSLRHTSRFSRQDNLKVGRLGVFIGSAGGSLEQQGTFEDTWVQWGRHEGEYVVPNGQTVTRFELRRLADAPSFIDDVEFGTAECVKVTVEHLDDSPRYFYTIYNGGKDLRDVTLTVGLPQGLRCIPRGPMLESSVGGGNIPVGECKSDKVTVSLGLMSSSLPVLRIHVDLDGESLSLSSGTHHAMLSYADDTGVHTVTSNTM